MEFKIDYKIPKEENENFDFNAYASYCVSFVNQIKEKLNFNKENLLINENGKDINIIRYSMDMPVIRKKIIRNCPSREKKNISNSKKEKILTINKKGVGRECQSLENSLK